MALTTVHQPTAFCSSMPLQNSTPYPFPVGTVARIVKTRSDKSQYEINEFIIIRHLNYVKDQRGFLNYLVEVEGKQGLYCCFHDQIELENLP